MSEKRKPTVIIVAEFRGKSGVVRHRTELYKARLWPDKFFRRDWGKYRVRIDGKWALGDTVFTLSNVMSQIRGMLAKRIQKDGKQYFFRKGNQQ